MDDLATPLLDVTCLPGEVLGAEVWTALLAAGNRFTAFATITFLAGVEADFLASVFFAVMLDAVLELVFLPGEMCDVAMTFLSVKVNFKNPKLRGHAGASTIPASGGNSISAE